MNSKPQHWVPLRHLPAKPVSHVVSNVSFIIQIIFRISLNITSTSTLPALVEPRASCLLCSVSGSSGGTTNSIDDRSREIVSIFSTTRNAAPLCLILIAESDRLFESSSRVFECRIQCIASFWRAPVAVQLGVSGFPRVESCVRVSQLVHRDLVARPSHNQVSPCRNTTGGVIKFCSSVASTHRYACSSCCLDVLRTSAHRVAVMTLTASPLYCFRSVRHCARLDAARLESCSTAVP
jgi:hypothetical protein